MKIKNVIFITLVAAAATNGFAKFTSVLADAYQAKVFEDFEKNKELVGDPEQREAVEKFLKSSTEAMINFYMALAEKFTFQDSGLIDYEKQIHEVSVRMCREATEDAVDSYIEVVKKFSSHTQKNCNVSRLDLLNFLGISTSLALGTAVLETCIEVQKAFTEKTLRMFGEKLNAFFEEEFGDVMEDLQKKMEAAA